MAVTAPTPPTPPTPPQISFDGEDVTSTAPSAPADSGGAASLEAQARQAVATGAGPLQKTEVTDPKAQQPAVQKPQAAQDAATGKGGTDGVSTTATAQSGTRIQQDQQVQQALAEENHKAGIQTAPPPPQSYTDYSGWFWAAAIVFAVAFSFFLLRMVLQRHKDADGLRLDEFFKVGSSGEKTPQEQAAEEPAQTEREKPDILTEYTGLHPDEVLARLSRESVVPKTNLKAYAAQGGKKKEKKAARSKAEKAPKPRPATTVPAKPTRRHVQGRGGKKKDDEPHFEARV